MRKEEKMRELIDARTRKQLDYYLPERSATERLARFFALFADDSRLRMLSALAISEMCVTDLARVLGMNQTTVSHQLRQLKDSGAVKQTRQGRVIFYSLADVKINEVLLCGVECLGC